MTVVVTIIILLIVAVISIVAWQVIRTRGEEDGAVSTSGDDSATVNTGGGAVSTGGAGSRGGGDARVMYVNKVDKPYLAAWVKCQGGDNSSDDVDPRNPDDGYRTAWTDCNSKLA